MDVVAVVVVDNRTDEYYVPFLMLHDIWSLYEAYSPHPHRRTCGMAWARRLTKQEAVLLDHEPPKFQHMNGLGHHQIEIKKKKKKKKKRNPPTSLKPIIQSHVHLNKQGSNKKKPPLHWAKCSEPKEA
jgi:hypothetical protein